MPDYQMIDVEGVLPLGQRWVFWGDALGSTVQFRVGHDEGELTLPDTPPGAPAGRGPLGSLHPPSWLVGAEADWGQVVAMPMRLSLVGALGIRVRLPWYGAVHPTREQIEGNAWHFATGLFPWMHQLRGWLSSIVGADLATEAAESLPGGIPDGVRLRHAGSADWEFEHEGIKSWDYSTAQAVNLAAWRRAVRLTSDQAELPVEHALLNAAYRALEQRDIRLGAIEAGAAAETALSGAIRSKLRAADGDLSELKRKTLGQLREHAEKHSVTCPDKLEFDKLLRPRNDAVHGNRPVSYPEVREAIRIASQIVHMHSPLPP
jgi:hypothetical protein